MFERVEPWDGWDLELEVRAELVADIESRRGVPVETVAVVGPR